MLRTALGPAIAGHLDDPSIVEVMLNPDGRLWIDRLAGGMEDTGTRITPADAERIVRLVAHHVGVEVHPGSPRVSAELPGSGERFEGLVPPVVAAPCFAIRRPAVALFSLDDYVAAGVMTAAQATFLRRAVAERKNILVAGGTSTGKTTLVNALLAEIAQTGDRVVLIEDTVTVWDEDPAIAADRLRLVEKTIQGRDFTCMRESVNALEAWFGSLPGHVYANVRQPCVSTLNLAHMIPLSAVWAGPERDGHFDAPPLFYARTEGSTPFRFALHVGDVGHTLIAGPTGAGKSVLLAFMAMQFCRYAGARIFAFDFGGSIRAATLAMGGDWHDLGGALAQDGNDAVALQPLARIDEPGERAWAAEWVATLLEREGVTVAPDLKEHLWSALTSLASAPVAERTITGLSALLQSLALKQALQPYCVGGPWGQLLDAEHERLGVADIQAFEIEGLIGSGAASAVLSYLFHRIEDRFDGSPTLLIIDEGWLALDDRAFAGQLREWLKTLRKKNASVIFATQSLADIDASPIAPALIESCPTRIFLPNDRALEPQITAIYRRFGLNDRQIEILSRATPKRDYYCQSRRGNRLFDLGLSEVALAFTAASSPDNQTAIDRIFSRHGRDGFAAAWLAHKGVEWAVEMLNPGEGS